MAETTTDNDLTHYAWISIAAAVLTITLKLSAYFLTNSVGLLSDALESLVNLAAAIVALIALRIAVRPANDEFNLGYSKVEFFSSGFEGGMILIASGSIILTAIPRLLNPQPIEQIGVGLVISIIASLINFGVARVLARAGERYGSITLQADARHLMTDVITTGGVILGIIMVSITGRYVLDPLIALLVAVNILFTGIKLLRQSYRGLMDIALPGEMVEKINQILESYEAQGVKFHALQTRSAAARGYVSMHILVPGNWSVNRGHQIAEQIEREIRLKYPQVLSITHVEPIDDPISVEEAA